MVLVTGGIRGNFCTPCLGPGRQSPQQQWQQAAATTALAATAATTSSLGTGLLWAWLSQSTDRGVGPSEVVPQSAKSVPQVVPQSTDRPFDIDSNVNSLLSHWVGRPIDQQVGSRVCCSFACSSTGPMVVCSANRWVFRSVAEPTVEVTVDSLLCGSIGEFANG